jgi:uncharacterized repeat protein (TIGR04076 family)
MPFKVRCKLVGFLGDVEHFPCHFDYKVGDEFTYNGARFEGADLCPHLLVNLMPTIYSIMFMGNKGVERMIIRYSGLSAKDPSRKKYDGVGFRPLTGAPAGADKKLAEVLPAERPQELLKGWAVICPDARTLANFLCEPVDLADGGDCLPYYNREMNALKKIKSEPGMTANEILNKFTAFERDEIYPPLTLFNLELMLDELAEVGYIELRNGKAYPK